MNYFSYSVYKFQKPFLCYRLSLQNIFLCHYSENHYKQYFDLLNIDENSDQTTTRNAFLRMAKKYHPDSGHTLSNAEKFQEIEDAYRKLLEKFRTDRHSQDCEGEFGLYYELKKKKNQKMAEKEEESSGKMFDIKHTAPQHRQYLNNEGIGMGTPSQRVKQFDHFKALRAAENVIDHKVKQLTKDHNETSLVTKDKQFTKRIKTRYGIERVVEDMIQESMAKGDFDNLPNAGKPLSYENHNPYVDVVTHKLNKILIDNGYAPRWILLEKEIKEDKAHIRELLIEGRKLVGEIPLSSQDTITWQNVLDNLKEELKSLNKKIDDYNLVVPMLNKQMVHFPIKRVAEEVLKEGLSNGFHFHSQQNIKQKPSRSDEIKGIKSLISIFKAR